MFSIFKRKTRLPQKRNFDNVAWNWVKTINGRQVNPFHVFLFENGFSVIVMKDSVQTWDGMMCIAVSEFKEDGKYKPLLGYDLPDGAYTRAEGLDEKGVDLFCEQIRNLRLKHN